MFIVIENDEYYRHQNLINQMHRVRKKVFSDRLKWNVTLEGDFEIDDYDRNGPVYIVWCDDQANTFFGCMRLMPTTGPTLLDDIFRRTYPSNVSLSAPSIWEGSRTCIDDVELASVYPGTTPTTAFGLIMLAVCEWSLEHHVETIVTNYEPYLARVYKKAGVEIDELGRADGFGRHPVCCGVVNISSDLLSKMRTTLGVTESLFGKTSAWSECFA